MCLIVWLFWSLPDLPGILVYVQVLVYGRVCAGDHEVGRGRGAWPPALRLPDEPDPGAHRHALRHPKVFDVVGGGGGGAEEQQQEEDTSEDPCQATVDTCGPAGRSPRPAPAAVHCTHTNIRHSGEGGGKKNFSRGCWNKSNKSKSISELIDSCFRMLVISFLPHSKTSLLNKIFLENWEYPIFITKR